MSYKSLIQGWQIYDSSEVSLINFDDVTPSWEFTTRRQSYKKKLRLKEDWISHKAFDGALIP